MARIIYNTTIKVDWSIAEDCLKWMQHSYIPAMMETGCFDKHQLVRLLEVDEADGPTYAIQYYAQNLTSYDYYLQHHAPGFRNLIHDKWGDKFIDFGTLMQVVEII